MFGGRGSWLREVQINIKQIRAKTIKLKLNNAKIQATIALLIKYERDVALCLGAVFVMMSKQEKMEFFREKLLHEVEGTINS